MSKIAQTPPQAYGLINPHEALPSGDERYVPLDEVRGTKNLADTLVGRIVALQEIATSGHARFLVTGHRGCGKTTELYRLKELLSQQNYAVVYFDAEEELNLQDLSWWNILLEMVWQIDEQLSQPPFNLTIPNHLREAATEWLAQVVTTKTERTDMEASLTSQFDAKAELPFFLKVKMAVKSLVKTGSSDVKKIQQAVERRPAQLHDAVNELVAYAQAELGKKQDGKELVVIVDGLEKIPLLVISGQITTHNNLFIHNARHLKEPQCHVIYTLPFALLTSGRVEEEFPPPLLMPMLHIRHRDREEDEHVIRTMGEILKRRVAPGLFDPGVVEWLAHASGGHIRDFLLLAQEAAGQAGQSAQISLEHAKGAIRGLVDSYNRTIKQEFIEPLDYVGQHDELPGGAHDRDLINLRLVLEYRNDETWFALHPCVEDAPRYRRAPRGRESESGA